MEGIQEGMTGRQVADALMNNFSEVSAEIDSSKTMVAAEEARAKGVEQDLTEAVAQNAGEIIALKGNSATKAELDAEAERAQSAEELISQQAEQNFRNFSELGVEESAKGDGYEIALAKKTNTAEKTTVKVPVYNTQDPSKTPVGLVDEIFVEDMGAMMEGKIEDALKGFKPEGGSTDVIDNLDSDSSTAALSANQGKVLNEKIEQAVGIIPRTDDVDITSENGKLRLANRLYDESNPTGKGYVILRKEKTLAEQITSPNTIYEIQDDWNLAGSLVVIPDGCTLKFDGGSLSNGTIQADNLVILAEYRVFDKIKFNGGIIENLTIESTWYMDGCSMDVRVDETARMQSMFDSNAINIHIDATKYYYITDTIRINHVVNVTGMPYGERGNNEVRADGMKYCPSIFTDKKITMFEYNHPSINSSYGFRRVNIGGFNLLSVYDYSNDGEIDRLPLVQINSKTQGGFYSALWGISIDINISVKLRTIYAGIQPCPNFVGVKFHASGASSYITYIKLNGYIQGVFCGFETKAEDSAWITTVEDYTDKNWICEVCDCPASPLFINGQNQNGYNRWKEVFPDVIFVKGGSVTLNGTLWDVPIGRKAIRCENFTNNCPIFMGEVDLTGNVGYSTYYPTSIAELPYQGKTNNILEGLNKNAMTPLSKRMYSDVGRNSVSGICPIKDYDIEIYDSADETGVEKISMKGKIKDELNIFNSEYLGLIKDTGGKYLFSGYDNTFDSSTYGSNTSIRYTFVLSDVFCIDHSAYVLTHKANFEKLRIKIEFRNTENVITNTLVIKETSASDYYRNSFYTQIGQLKGSNNYNNLHSGYSKLIIEYVNATSGVAIYPPVGLFNSTFKGVGVNGGNVVGRLNTQDVVHAIPGTSTMDIYYEYNELYGRSKELGSSYTRLFRCKYRYTNIGKMYFSFRTGNDWNYVEVKKDVVKTHIGNMNTTVKADIYIDGSLIYVDIYAKSSVAYSIDFGKLFCTYGVEFIDDSSTEFDNLTLHSTHEYKADIHKNTSNDVSTAKKIVKIKVSKGEFSAICVNGNMNERTISVLNLSTTNQGLPNKLSMENIANQTDGRSAHSPIAYYDPVGYCNVIEFTQWSPSYQNAHILPIEGNVISVECIESTSYDSNAHTDKIEGVLIKRNNSGVYENRPTGIEVGTAYFCTDKQTIEGASIGIMIYYKGNDEWVDALGRTIS